MYDPIRQAPFHTDRTANARQSEFRNVFLTEAEEPQTAALPRGDLGRSGYSANETNVTCHSGCCHNDGWSDNDGDDADAEQWVSSTAVDGSCRRRRHNEWGPVVERGLTQNTHPQTDTRGMSNIYIYIQIYIASEREALTRD